MQTLIISPITHRATLNSESDKMQRKTDGTPGDKTFDVLLHPIGAPDNSTPSHVWCSVKFRPSNKVKANKLKKNFAGVLMLDYDLVNEPNVPNETLASLGLRRTTSFF